MAIRAYKFSGIGGLGWYKSTVETGINFTSEEVTNAPVSKVYFNDKLVWAPNYKVTISYSANTLDKIEYTRGFPGENGYEASFLSVSSSATSSTVTCMEGQLLKITPVPKSGYAVTSHHDKFITITGDITIDITTKAATKGKLSAPQLLRGSSGMVDGEYRAFGTFKNPNNISVTAKLRPYCVDNSRLSQPTRDFYDRTYTFAAGAEGTVMVEGPAFYDYMNKTVLAVKFSAAGYEDSDWRVWSDYSALVNSSAYTTGQIPEISAENIDEEYNAYYEDNDNDGDYDIEIAPSTSSTHALRWPMVVQSPLGIYEEPYVQTVILYDVPPDNLKIKLTCYDPKGIFKPTTLLITNSDLTEASWSF